MSRDLTPSEGVRAPSEAVLDRALSAVAAEGARDAWDDEERPSGVVLSRLTAVERVGLSVTVGAVRRFAMTVSGRIQGPPGGPGFDPAHAEAVCTITDRNAPDEPPLQGALTMTEDGRFTITVLLEAWPEQKYPQGRLFVITVRARDRAGALGTSTTYLRVPPPAPLPAPSKGQAPPKPPRRVASMPDELLAEAAARPRPSALPLYVKGLHLAVKELREDHAPAAARQRALS